MSAQHMPMPATLEGGGVLRAAIVATLLLSLLPAALGIGFAPSSVDLRPGEPTETLVSVLNTEGITAKFRVHLEGELAPYMPLSPARFELSPAIPEAVIRVQAQAPPTLPSGPRTRIRFTSRTGAPGPGSSGSGSTDSWAPTRTSCRAACASGWRWPAPSRSSPSFC